MGSKEGPERITHHRIGCKGCEDYSDRLQAAEKRIAELERENDALDETNIKRETIIERLQEERDDIDAERNVANAHIALVEEMLFNEGFVYDGETFPEFVKRAWTARTAYRFTSCRFGSPHPAAPRRQTPPTTTPRVGSRKQQHPPAR